MQFTFNMVEELFVVLGQMASGWESEDTLSDGGDFFDSNEPEYSLAERTASLQRMSSIPIVAVTKVGTIHVILVYYRVQNSGLLMLLCNVFDVMLSQY